jgi:hypothetical protein
MKFILLGLPLLINLATLAAVVAYPIDAGLHARLRRALAWRSGRTPPMYGLEATAGVSVVELR